MATIKPRITVTLDETHHAVLTEMARLTNTSMSSIIASIVTEAVPVFARVVKLIKEAEATKSSVADRVKELASEAELQMLPLARDALKTFDMFDDAVMKAIADAKATEDSAEAGRGDPARGESRPASKGRGRQGGTK